ncbi:hypothetical protein TrRE_jg11482 [Triparma retinervis]|uniref:Uncharacterized protein n=1 Tax=Triparma retinervis TaxID=2557542 RepID=A0A9W7DKX9_9STRA|nr:hypothetical protein TrRE_jg11482 [Triparma retinervis]
MSSFAVPAQDVPIFSPQVEPSTTSTLRNYARRASRALVGDTPNLIQSQEEKFAQLRQRVPSEFIVNRVSGGFFEGRVKNIDKSLQNKTFSVARAGRLDIMKTLCASPFYASLYYNLGGKTMAYATITQGMRQKGLTVMALAGMNKDIEMVRWLHCEKRMPIAIIDDVRVLQELLEKMFREQNSESPSFNPVQATVAWAETVVIDNNDNSDPPVFQAELVE